MYRANPGTVEAQTRDWLKEKADSRRIEIGLSYHLIFELLQKARPMYRDDRMARARLLSELCGQNAFPYPTDLGQGYTFSNEGLWVPRIDMEDLEIERVVEHVMEGMARLPGINRHERRILSKRFYFGEWLRSNPSVATDRVLEVWPLRFGHAFVESGGFTHYLSGRMTRADANKKIRFYITDPVTVYGIWFEDYGRDDPIAERRDRLVSGFMAMLDQLRRMLDASAQLEGDIKNAFADRGERALMLNEREALMKLSSDVRSFKAELNSPKDLYERVPKWQELFGDDSALVAAQILYAFHRERRPIRRSDGIDFVHAMYLPHTDLWRGDKAFSDLLIKHRVNFSDRIIPSLSDVPARVEAQLSKSGLSVAT